MFDLVWSCPGCNLPQLPSSASAAVSCCQLTRTLATPFPSTQDAGGNALDKAAILATYSPLAGLDPWNDQNVLINGSTNAAEAHTALLEILSNVSAGERAGGTAALCSSPTRDGLAPQCALFL